MAPPPKECPVAGCEYKTPATLPNYDLVYRDLDIHTKYTHINLIPTTASHHTGEVSTATAKADKLRRPELKEGATEADFIYFKDSWTRYKRSTCLSGQAAVDQLWDCCSPELSRSVYDSGVTCQDDENVLIGAMKRLAVRAQNNLVNIVTFLGLGQDNEEPGGSFTARLKGQAAICDFTVQCSVSTCQNQTSYAEQMVSHQLVRGLVDPAIQEQILAHAASQKDLSLDEIQKFIEAKEIGRRSGALIAGTSGLNRISSDYKNGKIGKRLRIRSNSESSSHEKCGWCGKAGHGARASLEIREQKCKSFKTKCDNCSKVGHYTEMCRRKKGPTNNSLSSKPEERVMGTFCNLTTTVKKGRHIRTLPHHTYDMFRGWTQRTPESHPAVSVTMSLCSSAYEELALPMPSLTDRKLKMHSLPDTGAQMVVAGPPQLHKMGITKRELIPLSGGVNTADNAGLGLLGGVLVNITGQCEDGSSLTSKQLCYIAEGIDCLFLSKQACRELGIIGDNFPTIGAHSKGSDKSNNLASMTEVKNERVENRPCDCPTRTLPPPTPTTLPFPATEENREKLEKWIRESYASSAFNQCSHQPLPLIKSTPPLQLHVDPKAKPIATHKPVPIPINWMKDVKEQLDKDVRLGVLELVPVGQPVQWCSRMVVCPKKDGKPRRTVDLSKLNKVSARQTHPTESPFHQAVSVPKDTYKTVLDCWEGYHSVPLAEEDRHYTRFITPFGLYQYRTSPQGFLASGDGYTGRYDRIVTGFGNLTKCVDDSLLWDSTLENIFFRTCKYLTLCSSHGIIFNKKKFKFGEKEVEFLGFEITSDSVRPSPTFLEAIQDFPQPRDITGIRSWFGLINQVSYAFSMTEVMQPFRALLKPSTEFKWTDELQEAFEKSKEVITEAVKDGIMTFEMDRTTCLATDWSKTGIGFALLQKYCTCSDITPICCNSGWKLVFAGSRFTSDAESRYSPVEGEALAAVFGLKRAKHFTLGCSDLVLAVDHMPLLAILGNKNLDEVENPRLQRLKEKTLRFNFKIIHVPGVKHKAADATSRHPTGKGEHMEIACHTIIEPSPGPERLSKVFLKNLRRPLTEDELEESLIVEQQTIGHSMARLAQLSWNESDTDKEDNKPCVPNACSMSSITPISWQDVEEESANDEKMSDLNKFIRDGTPSERALWPAELEEYHRHRDHLSTVGPVVLYKDRAVLPASLHKKALEVLHSAHQGVTSMVGRAVPAVFWPRMQEDIIRARQACSSCDKNTPSQPAAPPKPLPTPSYPFQMIVSDYFSHAGKKFLIIADRYSGWLSVYQGGQDGADSLIKELKTHFTTFGISDELASDGAGEYTSGKTKKFLKDWKVKLRLSSAYFAHSNQRAELGVRAAKRMLRENLTPTGSLDSDKFLRALLTYRNTPDRDTGKSPAQIIFGHPIKDFFPVHPQKFQPRPEWLLTAEQREIALARRHARQGAVLTEHTKVLKPLSMSDVVLVQNQAGRRGKKWDRTGVVIEVLDHDQYRIKMDGSGRPSLRNRRFLKPITPFHSPVQQSIDLTSIPHGHDQPLAHGAADDQHPHDLAEHAPPTDESSAIPEYTPPLPPTQPTSVSAPSPPQQPDEPAVRRSGREKKLNTRLVGFELGSFSICHRISGASGGEGDN